MSSGDNINDEQVRQILELINQRKELLVKGLDGIRALKQVLAHLVQRAEVTIEWDPSTPAAIRERFSTISLSAARWSLAGAAAGLAVGVCTNKPALWTGVGAGVAALLGAYQGHCAIKAGWRLRGYRDENGVEYVEVKVRALPAPTS